MKQSLETKPYHQKLCQKWIVHNSTEKWIQFPNRAHELMFSLSCQFSSQFFSFHCEYYFLFQHIICFHVQKNSLKLIYMGIPIRLIQKKHRFSCSKTATKVNFQEENCILWRIRLWLQQKWTVPFYFWGRKCSTVFFSNAHRVINYFGFPYIVYCSINYSGFNACYRSRMRISRYSL